VGIAHSGALRLRARGKTLRHAGCCSAFIPGSLNGLTAATSKEATARLGELNGTVPIHS